MRIEVGYGLEGAVTDYVASSIIQNTFVPTLKKEIIIVDLLKQ